jgi:uncharacterized coiled-coil protein SlyX
MSSSPIPNTGDPRVDAALGRICLKFLDLEDALLVQVRLEKHLADNVDEFKMRLRDDVEELRSVMAFHNKTLKSHNELLAAHDEFPASHHEFLEYHEETLRIHEDMLRSHAAANKSHEAFRVEHQEWVKHMRDKLDALTDIIMRREGGLEARQ